MLVKLENLIKQLAHSEQEELCKYVQSQYCVDNTDDTVSSDGKMIEAVKEIVKQSAWESEVRDIELSMSLKKDLSIDKLDRAQIVSRLETEFYVDIRDRDALRWKTVRDIVNYIKINDKGE